MSFERPFRPLALSLRPARLATLASLTASLLLGACSGASDLLPSIAMKPTDNETADTTPTTPQNELQRATVYWGQEYAKKPTELKPALNYAKNLKAMGEKQKAFAVLQQASVFHSNDPELAGEYGRLALEFDQVGAANQLLSVADDPTKPDWRIISARGTVMAKQGKYSEAVPFYERALALAPDNPTILNNLAMAYAGMGDPQKAEGILRQAMGTPGATPQVRENLALVLGLQGRYDESRSVATGVLNSDTASANADYLKQMVKLDAKSAMPDAQSFVAQTSVAREAPDEAAPQRAVATAQAPASATPQSTTAAWQTTVGDITPLAPAFKGATP
jgi:Flp pilus assembly protein TadD